MVFFQLGGGADSPIQPLNFFTAAPTPFSAAYLPIFVFISIGILVYTPRLPFSPDALSSSNFLFTVFIAAGGTGFDNSPKGLGRFNFGTGLKYCSIFPRVDKHDHAHKINN